MNMRAGFGKVLAILLMSTAGLALSGCSGISSPHDYALSGIGATLEVILETTERAYVKDPEDHSSREDVLKQRYKLSNGNTVYPVAVNFKRCLLHWEVNPDGIIVGYHYEDVVKNGCKW